MSKSTPITSRIQKRSIGGIVQPAIEGMGSVAKMDNKIHNSPAKVDPKNKYNSKGRSERNQSVRNAIASFFTPDGSRDPRLSKNKGRIERGQSARDAVVSFFTPDGSRDPRLSKNRGTTFAGSPGSLKNYTGEGVTVEKTKNKSEAKQKFAGRTPHTVENGKGKIHGPKDSYKTAYKKRDMKLYGDMDLDQYTKEAKRQTKSFETTGKFDAPKKARKKVAKVASLKSEGAKKMSIENIATPEVKAKKLVAKAPKTAKQTRKSASIDKKLAKAKAARASGNVKKAERKEKRAAKKQERIAKRNK